MKSQDFIKLFRELFGNNVSLPIVYNYTNEPMANTPKFGGCIFKKLVEIDHGEIVSVNTSNLQCGGGRFYTGFTDMPNRVPNYVSATEHYKQTADLVLQSIRQMDVQRAPAEWLNIWRVDQTETLDDIEGMIFLATPDELSGLCGWAFYDNSDPEAVLATFGSGCSALFANVTTENKRGGQRCFIGLFDPSARAFIDKDKLGLGIPKSRLETMLFTVNENFLTQSSAWAKIKDRM